MTTKQTISEYAREVAGWSGIDYTPDLDQHPLIVACWEAGDTPIECVMLAEEDDNE